MPKENYKIEDGLDDSILEDAVKNRLDYGDEANTIRLDLAKKGYKLDRVDSVIKKYSEENIKSEADPELVKKIEQGFFNGESMQDVINKLYHTGYSKEDFKRAIPLVNIKTKIELVKMVVGWNNYYIILQTWVFFATVLVGIFYNKAFFFASLVMAGQIIIEYFLIKKNKQIREKTEKLPFENEFDIDFLLKEENLQKEKVGSKKAFFNRIIESHYLISIFFLLFGIGFGLMYGLMFFVISAVFSIVSFVSFWRPVSG